MDCFEIIIFFRAIKPEDKLIYHTAYTVRQLAAVYPKVKPPKFLL